MQPERKHKYEEMFPDEFEREFKKAPIAYLACGGLEIHGGHNALGLDGYIGYDIALASAKLSGGVVLPPFFIAVPGGAPKPLGWDVLRGMKAAELGHPSIWHGRELLTQLVEQTLWNLEKIGFKVCMLLPGHAPNAPVLEDYCRAIQYRLRTMVVEVVYVLDDEYSTPLAKNHGGHGGIWESSVFKYFHPELVDVSRLKTEKEVVRKSHAHIVNPLEIRAEVGAKWVAEVSRRIAQKALAILREKARVPPCRPDYVTAYQVSRARPFSGNINALKYPGAKQRKKFVQRVFWNTFCVIPEFAEYYKGKPLFVYYGFNLVCSKSMRIDLGLKYDGPVKVWLDGKVRFCDEQGHPPASGSDGGDKTVIPMELSRGRHAALIALVSDRSFAAGIRVHLQRRHDDGASDSKTTRLPKVNLTLHHGVG